MFYFAKNMIMLELFNMFSHKDGYLLGSCVGRSGSLDAINSKCLRNVGKCLTRLRVSTGQKTAIFMLATLRNRNFTIFGYILCRIKTNILMKCVVADLQKVRG